MEKYVRPIIFGVVAGIAGGILVKWLVFPEGAAWLIYALGIGLVVAYFLSNLAGNRKVAAAGAAERQQAMRMAPPAGKAMLIPYREGVVAKLAGLDLAIDGKPFAQLLSPQFTCVLLSPGSHTLTGAFGGLAGAQSKPASWAFEAAPGSVLAVRIDSALGMTQGAVKFILEADLEKLKKKMDRMRMAAVDVPEI
jgi:hypothetical protein